MDLTRFSEKITNVLTDDLNYNEEKKEIVAFGLESIILAIIGLIVLVITAILFNALVPTIIAALFGGLLRKVSGGAHFSTPVKCLAYGAIVYSILGFLAKRIIMLDLQITFILLTTLIICLILVAVFAPVDCPAKPINSSVFKKKLKIASIALVAATFLIVIYSKNNLLNTSAVFGIGYQTLTLLPIFNKMKKEG